MKPWLAKNIVYRSIQWIRREKVLGYLKDIRDLDKLSVDQIREVQATKLGAVLAFANARIPYYRDLFSQHGLSLSEMDPITFLSRVPLLSRSILQQNPHTLRDRHFAGRLSHATTSGTLGAPLTLAIDRHKSAMVRAVMYRNYGQYGIEVGDRQARLWGVSPTRKLRLKNQLMHLLANRISLSAFKITDAAFARFTDNIRKFAPSYFYGYPSLLHKYACWLQERNLTMKDLNLKAIITSGELLYDFQREAIKRVFQSPVVNEYGTSEIGIIAFECPEGRLHINSDHLILQSLDGNEVDGQGPLVITELNNFFNPLIRYQLGDWGAISGSDCFCGSHFPILIKLAGREGNFIRTPDNKLHFSAILSYTFAKGIKQFQGIQNSKEELIVHIVREDELTESLLDHYRSLLTKVLGDQLKITFNFVTHIETEKSGKLRYFISNIRS